MIEQRDGEKNLSPSVFLETCDIRPDDALSIKLSIKHSNKYPAKQHARRVADKLQVSAGLIYLLGQATVPLEDSDQDRVFRQRRYFFYLSGVNEPDCHLTYDIGSDTLTLFVPNFDLRRSIWMGPTLGLDEAMKRYDIDEVKYYSSLDKYVRQWSLENNRKFPIYALHDSQKPVGAQLSWWIDSDRLLPAMDACRVIKDDHEIGLIRRANNVSAAAHKAVLARIERMKNEAEIEATFLDLCISHGAHSQSYAIIAASGENAATLHYTKNNEPFGNRQFVCLDAGAEWNCYASDVTRTFPLKGEWPSEEARDMYTVVEQMQEECIALIKPGVRYLDLHILAHEIAIARLLDLGILKGGTVEEIRRSGASSVFFPHGLGHHVGLEVHDVSPKSLMTGNLYTLKDYGKVLCSPMHLTPCTMSAPVLEAGMVLTVEPGIYFSELALKNAQSQPLWQYIDMDVVKRYMPVGGVRIEDDILVTEEGYENLTGAPKGEAMLGIIRRGY